MKRPLLTLPDSLSPSTSTDWVLGFIWVFTVSLASLGAWAFIIFAVTRLL